MAFAQELEEMGKYETINRSFDSTTIPRDGAQENRDSHGLTRMGYANAVMPMSSCEVPNDGQHASYELPRQTHSMNKTQKTYQGGGHRARINEMYEGQDQNVQGEHRPNVRIFEAIRDLNFSEPKRKKGSRCKKCCCYFTIILLFLVSLTSLAASGYIFYKYDILHSFPRQNCTVLQVVQSAVVSVNDKKNENNVSMVISLLSMKIKALEKSIYSLEERSNASKLQNLHFKRELGSNAAEISKINQSLHLGQYWSQSLQELREDLSLQVRQLEILSSQINTTMRNEIETVKNNLAKKPGFENCTLEIDKTVEDFKNSNLLYVDIPKKSIEYTILGVGCTTKQGGVASQLDIGTNGDGETTFTCVFEKQKSAAAINFTCIMYYWQCLNN